MPPLPGCHGLASKPLAWDIVERFKTLAAFPHATQPASDSLISRRGAE